MVPISLLMLLFSSVVHCHHDIIDHSVCSGIKQEQIRGTDLKTGTFYKVTTQNTDTYHMTWSYKAHSTYGHRYVISDEQVSNVYQYEKGEAKYFHAQWFFLPAKGHNGWYHIANRAIPGEFLTWSYKSGETFGNNNLYHYIVLDPTYSPNHPKSEYLFKPVKRGTHYQIKSKSLPNSLVDVLLDGSSQKHVIINNDPADFVHQKSGGKWYAITLFKFELVDNAIKMQATISKIQITDNLTEITTGTADFTQEKLATKSIFVNNATSVLTEKYLARKEITESVFIQRPNNFTKFYKVGVEDAVEIEGDPGIPFLKTPAFNQQLISFYSADQSSTSTWNYTQSREFHTNQTIEVTKCTEYEVTASVNIVKDYPIEYIVYFKVTGEEDGEQISSVDLRDEHFNDQAEFVEILDEYTVLAKAKAKMWVTFARDSAINGQGSQIDSCVGEYVCNQIEN